MVKTGLEWTRMGGHLAKGAGLEFATKRLTAIGLRLRFVLRIAGIGPIESHFESHARRPRQVLGPC
jgi:hypothetical protein